MDAFLALISLSVGVFGSLLLSFTGVAVGAAARYGLPEAWRPAGGLALSIAGIILLVVFVAVSVGAKDGGKPLSFDWVVWLVGAWLPGFIAAALGANRFMIIATFPIAVVLVSFLSQLLGAGFGAPLL